jgi:flagellar protein FliL
MPEADTKEKSSPGRPVVKIVIAVILVLLVGGGGFVGWTLLQTDRADGEAGKGAVKKEKPYTAPVTYTLNTYIVNLMGSAGMSNRYLKIGVLLGLEDPSHAVFLDEYKPLLNDAALMLLSSKTYNELATVEGKIVLKQELISRLNQILGRQAVETIYFSEFVVQ